MKGPAFIVKRKEEPLHLLVIMNRIRLKTLVDPLNAKLYIVNWQSSLTPSPLEVQGDYLMYRNSTGRIYGLWFYSKEKRESFHKTLMK